MTCSPLRLIVRSWLDVPTFANRRPHACHHARAPSGGRWTVGEKYPRILPKCRFPRYIYGSFPCRKATTWDRLLYFRSERKRAEDFFRPKNPTASAGCEPANLGTKGQHATSRPPKTLTCWLRIRKPSAIHTEVTSVLMENNCYSNLLAIEWNIWWCQNG